ncbi:MAG: hypothetical protein HON94_04370 [Methylococcales bacterium]|jgi:hypothetical protein|nr:hypothetical protein [Methylococcales bacterium]
MVKYSKYSQHICTFILAVCLPFSLQADEKVNQPYQIIDLCLQDVFYQSSNISFNESYHLDSLCPELLGHVDNKFSKDTSMTINELMDYQQLKFKPIRIKSSHWQVKPKRLQQIIDESFIHQQTDKTLKWWDQFVQWIKDFFPEEKSVNSDWIDSLSKIIASFQSVIEALFYLSIGLIIAVLVWIAYNEMKIAGLFMKKRKVLFSASDDQLKDHLVNIQYSQISFTQISTLPQNNQPLALLSYCINQLIEKNYLPNNKSYTNWETIRLLQKFEAQLSFQHLVQLVERIEYGGDQVNDESLRLCESHTHTILEAL